MRLTMAIASTLTAVAAMLWLARHDDPMIEIDESAWVLKTGQLREAWELGTLRAPTWQGRAASAHPPVGAIPFAVVLAPGDLWIMGSQPHEWWLDEALRVFHRREFLAQVAQLVTPAHLSRARAVAAAAFVVAGLLLFAAIRRVFGAAEALGATALFACCPLVWLLAGQAVGDLPFVALLLGTVALTLACVQAVLHGAADDESIAHPRQRRALIARALALGLLCGLLMNVKLNGAASLPAALLSLCAAVIDPRDLRRTLRATRKPLALVVGAATLSFLVAAYATNPAFWPDPIAGVRAALRWRLEAIEVQQIVFYGDWLRTPTLQSAAFVDAVLARTAPFGLGTGGTRVVGGAVMGALVALGIARAWQVRQDPRAGSPGVRAFACLSAVWIVLTLLTYVFRWERYTLPAVPFVLGFAGVGAAHVVRVARQPPLRSRRFALTAAGGVLAGALLTVLCGLASLERDKERHPHTWRELRLRQVDWFLSREPNDPILFERKAHILR